MFVRDISSQIKSVFKSKAGKNGIWLYIAQFFNTICPIIVIPYITRILGTEKYGAFSIALNIIGYLQVLVEYGFGMSATRKMAQNDKDDEYCSKLFSLVLVSRAILLLASLITILIYAFVMRGNQQIFTCSLILGVTLFGYCIQLNWLYQGKQDMMLSSIVSMITRIASLCLTFVFVKTDSDIYIYCWIYSLTPIIGSVVCILIAKIKYKMRFKRINVKEIWRELKDGFYVFTTQLSSKIFSAIGLTFLGIFSTEYISGIFSAVQKIPYVVTICWMPISQVLYPIMSQKFSVSFEHGFNFVKKVMFVMLVLFGSLLIIIGCFAKIILNIAFGEDYSNYFFWLYPQLIWVLVGIVNNFLGIQTLLASGNDKKYARCFYVAVIFNISCNALFVYLWEGWGASIAPLISELILLILLIISIRGILKKRKLNEKKENNYEVEI